MVQMKPIDLKEAAKKFTEKYYPQWLSRVDRIWNMFEKIDPESFVSESSDSQSQLGNAFGIAGGVEPKFQECLSGIAIFAFTYQGVKDKNTVSEDEIRKKISIIPNLKMTPGVQKKLESVLADILPSMVGEAVEEKSQVTFTDIEIHFPETEVLNKDYPFAILEFILLEGKIHWLWGFVLFGSWANIIEKHPKIQFGNYFSKINKKIRGYGFYVEHIRGGDEWRINIDKTKNNVSCNLMEANDYYIDAIAELKKGSTEVALEKLISAIHPAEYKNVKYISAYKLIVTCIFRLSYEKISETLLNEVAHFLRWYKSRLENAVFSIKHIYLFNNKFSESEVEYEFKELENELKLIKNHYEAICNKVVVSENDKAYEELLEFMLNLKILVKEVGEPDEKMKEIIFESETFTKLKHNKIIKKLFKDKTVDLQFLPIYVKDKEETENYFLYSMLKNGINLDVCNNLFSLNRYLKNRLSHEIAHFSSR